MYIIDGSRRINNLIGADTGFSVILKRVAYCIIYIALGDFLRTPGNGQYQIKFLLITEFHFDWLNGYFVGAIHSTKISGNFGPKLNGSVRSNRKSFEKTGPPFEVVLFSRSDRLELWLNGSRPVIEVSFQRLADESGYTAKTSGSS